MDQAGRRNLNFTCFVKHVTLHRDNNVMRSTRQKLSSLAVQETQTTSNDLVNGVTSRLRKNRNSYTPFKCVILLKLY